MIVAEASYESTDPSVDSQIATLQGSGADTFFSFASPKFAAQSIRKAYDIGWKPLLFIPYSATSVNAVLQPAGLREIGGRDLVGVCEGSDRSAMEGRRGDQGMAGLDEGVLSRTAIVADIYNVYAYTNAQLLVQVLKQCGDDLTRENVMKQAASLKNLELPMLLPGVTINTSATDYDPIKQLQLMRFDGKEWVRFGEVTGP